MAVSTKMSVDVSGFKQGMQEAAAVTRTLDAELKRNEAQFKATGNAEQYMADKANLLQMKMNTQKTAITNLEKALAQMRAAGVDPLNKEYQKLQTELANAQTGLLNTSVEMNNLATSEENASRGAETLNENVQKIGRKMSLEQVITGINSITSVMEKAGRAAVDLGKKIWENITDSARYADDIATSAAILDMSTSEYQKLKGVLDTVADLTVQEWTKAKQKVQKAIHDPTDSQTEILSLLGVSTHQMLGTAKYGGYIEGAARNYEEVLWEIGQRLKDKVARGELSQDLADVYAQEIFGKSFSQLKPLFDLGEEGFNAAKEGQLTNTEKAIDDLAKLNDALVNLQGDFEKLKTEVMGKLAPALTTATEALDGLLESILEYLKTPQGQESLQQLGESISTLFKGLGEINPQDVVDKFSSVLDTVVDSATWIANHYGEVVTGIKAIAGAFIGLKIAEAGLTFIKFTSGLKDFLHRGGSGTGEPTITGDGGSGGTGFPWLTGLFNKISGGMQNFTSSLTMFDPNGLSALILPALGDLTVAGRRIRDGGTIGDALATIPKTIEASFNQAVDNWKNWWPSMAEAESNFLNTYFPNAFKSIGPNMDDDALQRMKEEFEANFSGMEPTVEVTPKAVEGSAEILQTQIGPVPVMVIPQLSQPFGFPGGGGGGNLPSYEKGLGDYHPHANGIWSVPWDGYPAILHRGERVMPAREVRSGNSYSSNLYVESMYMNNGTDAEGLAAAMAAAQRRTRAGYGS